MIRDSAGALHGTTFYGGACNSGTVFKLDETGKETVLYSFAAGSGGANPCAGVIRDAAGNLYGTASRGGAAGCGVVFRLTP